MRRLLRFQRRITREEADTCRILVQRRLLDLLEGFGTELQVCLDGEPFAAQLVSEPCACGGVDRPHCHHFLLLRGDVPLESGRRITVLVEAA